MTETFINSKEDMDWLFDVHCPAYRGMVRSAIIEGNEDCPSVIHLFISDEPVVGEEPVVSVRPAAI